MVRYLYRKKVIDHWRGDKWKKRKCIGEEIKNETTGNCKKISRRIMLMVIFFNLILGAAGIYCSYTAAINSMLEVMDHTSQLAANLVTANLREYSAVAYETGSIARLADPDRSVEEKETIIRQKEKMVSALIPIKGRQKFLLILRYRTATDGRLVSVQCEESL